MPELVILNSSVETKIRSIPFRTRLSFSKEEVQETPMQQVDFFAATPACLSDWFIQTLTQPGDMVCDVFAGRGTTAISAYQYARFAIANDLNPLTEILIKGRIALPTVEEFQAVLKQALHTPPQAMSESELKVFPLYFAPRTLEQLWPIRTYLLENSQNQVERESIDCLRFLLAESLLGKGTEMLSISLPGIGRMPRPEVQAKRNLLRNQGAESEKNVEALLLHRFHHFQQARIKSNTNIVCLNRDATDLPDIADRSVQLHFTVPPEMNTRSYLDEHWLRLMFFDIQEEDLNRKLPALYTPETWQNTMVRVMAEQKRTLSTGGRSVWVLADSPHISEVLLPRLIQAGYNIGWLVETEYICQIPSKKTKKSLQGNIAVRVLQFRNK